MVVSSDRSPLSVVDRKIGSRGIEMSSSQEPIPPSRVRETSSLEKILTLTLIVVIIKLTRVLFGVIHPIIGSILQNEDLSLLHNNLIPFISGLLVGSPSVRIVLSLQRG